jgi:hypothetical protein
MPPVRIRSVFVVLLALAATAVAAELAKWDQARATAGAQQLAASCDAWEQSVRRQPGEGLGSGDAAEAGGLLQNARILKEQSATLASHLAAGKGHDETRDLYRSLKEIVHDTEERAQRAELDAPMLAAWAKVADGLRGIAPYYDAETGK